MTSIFLFLIKIILNKNIELRWYQDYKNIKFYLKNDERIMPKTPQIKLPKQLWTEDCIDLTRHSYQGKLLTKTEGFKLGKAQRQKVSREQLSQLSQRPKGLTALNIYDWSNQGRLEQLKPIRAKRMSVSPFTYIVVCLL